MADVIELKQAEEQITEPRVIKTYPSKEWIPPEGDESVGKTVFSMAEASIKDKIDIGLHGKWQRDYELRMNKHWKNNKVANVKLTEANLLYTHIQRAVNNLTDNNPTFNLAIIGGDGQVDKDIYNGLQWSAEHWWIDQEQQDVLETSVLNGETYNFLCEKVIFNTELEYNQGEVETLNIDPYNFGWYPVKLRNLRHLQKHPVLLHWEAIPVFEIKRQYPKLATKIKPIGDLLKELNDERREISSQIGEQKSQSMFVSILTTVKELFETGKGAIKDDSEEDLVVEAWVLDKTMVDREYPDGTVQNEPLYPGYIRMIRVCQGGKVVLEDRPNPNINKTLPKEQAVKTYLYDKRPFICANSVKDTSNAWGMTHDVEQLHKLNIEIDKTISQLVYLKDKAARAKTVNPRNSGVQNYEFTDESGIINPTTAETGNGIRILEYPQMPVDVHATLEVFKNLFMQIGGTFDYDIAQSTSKGALAYKTVAALIERAATMNRGKIRSYSRVIRERGRMYLSHVMNFYSEDRWIPHEDRLGQTEFVKINGHNMILPVKLTVVSGSTMPVSKIQQREEAIALHERGAIDQQELLERLDWPNRGELIKRMQLGPIGVAMQKLSAIGTPEQLVEFMAQIVTMDDKEFKRAAEQGKLPSFMAILQQIMAQQAGQEQPPDPESMKAQAEVEKILADRDLVREKIVTEQVNQQATQAGIRFDEEQLKIKRAEVVTKAEANVNKFETDMMSSMAKNKPGYNEKGGKSNNKKE